MNQPSIQLNVTNCALAVVAVETTPVRAKGGSCCCEGKDQHAAERILSLVVSIRRQFLSYAFYLDALKETTRIFTTIQLTGIMICLAQRQPLGAFPDKSVAIAAYNMYTNGLHTYTNEATD